MAQKRVAFTAALQTLATAPEHKRIKPKAIIIADKAAGAKVLTFTDVFTTDASVGAVAAVTTNTWLTVLCSGSGTMINFDESALKGIELLGAVKVISDVADATSFITFAYDLE